MWLCCVYLEAAFWECPYLRRACLFILYHVPVGAFAGDGRDFRKKWKKCADCPYHLGRIQCVKDPCPACGASGVKKHPFPKPVIRGGAEYSKMTAIFRRHKRGKDEMYDD